MRHDGRWHRGKRAGNRAYAPRVLKVVDMALTNAEKQKRGGAGGKALAANEALRNRAMNATQHHYPPLSQWPTSAPVPTRALLVQAYALLRAARPRARPEGSHKALAVAAYLSGHYW